MAVRVGESYQTPALAFGVEDVCKRLKQSRASVDAYRAAVVNPMADRANTAPDALREFRALEPPCFPKKNALSKLEMKEGSFGLCHQKNSICLKIIRKYLAHY